MPSLFTPPPPGPGASAALLQAQQQAREHIAALEERGRAGEGPSGRQQEILTQLRQRQLVADSAGAGGDAGKVAAGLAVEQTLLQKS